MTAHSAWHRARRRCLATISSAYLATAVYPLPAAGEDVIIGSVKDGDPPTIEIEMWRNGVKTSIGVGEYVQTSDTLSIAQWCHNTREKSGFVLINTRNREVRVHCLKGEDSFTFTSYSPFDVRELFRLFYKPSVRTTPSITPSMLEDPLVLQKDQELTATDNGGPLTARREFSVSGVRGSGIHRPLDDIVNSVNRMCSSLTSYVSYDREGNISMLGLAPDGKRRVDLNIKSVGSLDAISQIFGAKLDEKAKVCMEPKIQEAIAFGIIDLLTGKWRVVSEQTTTIVDIYADGRLAIGNTDPGGRSGRETVFLLVDQWQYKNGLMIFSKSKPTKSDVVLVAAVRNISASTFELTVVGGKSSVYTRNTILKFARTRS
jgi:hypothetical protein